MSARNTHTLKLIIGWHCSINYASPPWKIFEFALTLLLGFLITVWWRLPGSLPQWVSLSVYYSSFALVTYLAVRLKYLQYKADAKSSKEFMDDQKALVHLLNTMPPAYAMDTFIESYGKALDVKRAIESYDWTNTELGYSEKIHAYQDCIRLCLAAYAKLYVQFEHKPRSTECVAHWLPHIHINELSLNPDLKKLVKEHLRFVDNPDDPLYDIDGVLKIDPALTVLASNRQDAKEQQDPNAEFMFLPINRDRGTDRANGRCFPVAPLAFKGQDVTWITNVSEQITMEYLQDWNVSQQVIRDLYDYFREKQHIGSIIGNPLILDDFPLGVVVIFTKDEDSKDSKAVVNSYLTLCRPLFEMQKDLVWGMLQTQSDLESFRQGDSAVKG